MGCASSKPEPPAVSQAQNAASSSHQYAGPGNYQQAPPPQQYGVPVPGSPGGQQHAPMGMAQQPGNGYNQQQHMPPPQPQSHQKEGSQHGGKGLLSRLSFRTSNRSVIEGKCTQGISGFLGNQESPPPPPHLVKEFIPRCAAWCWGHAVCVCTYLQIPAVLQSHFLCPAKSCC